MGIRIVAWPAGLAMPQIPEGQEHVLHIASNVTKLLLGRLVVIWFSCYFFEAACFLHGMHDYCGIARHDATESAEWPPFLHKACHGDQ